MNLLAFLLSSRTLSDFLPPLLQLSASPIYSVRMMASKALVAMTPPSEYMNILINLTSQLPSPQQQCSHNRLHGQLLQIKAILERALCSNRWDLKELFILSSHTFRLSKGFVHSSECRVLKSCCVSISSAPSDDLFEVLSRIIASLWMVTEAQRCPLVRAVYLDVVHALRRFCCETYLSDLSSTLLRHLQTPQQSLQVCELLTRLLGP